VHKFARIAEARARKRAACTYAVMSKERWVLEHLILCEVHHHEVSSALAHSRRLREAHKR
jgi:hypothetical protein